MRNTRSTQRKMGKKERKEERRRPKTSYHELQYARIYPPKNYYSIRELSFFGLHQKFERIAVAGDGNCLWYAFGVLLKNMGQLKRNWDRCGSLINLFKKKILKHMEENMGIDFFVYDKTKCDEQRAVALNSMLCSDNREIVESYFQDATTFASEKSELDWNEYDPFDPDNRNDKRMGRESVDHFCYMWAFCHYYKVTLVLYDIENTNTFVLQDTIYGEYVSKEEGAIVAKDLDQFPYQIIIDGEHFDVLVEPFSDDYIKAIAKWVEKSHSDAEKKSSLDDDEQAIAKLKEANSDEDKKSSVDDDDKYTLDNEDNRKPSPLYRPEKSSVDDDDKYPLDKKDDRKLSPLFRPDPDSGESPPEDTDSEESSSEDVDSGEDIISVDGNVNKKSKPPSIIKIDENRILDSDDSNHEKNIIELDDDDDDNIKLPFTKIRSKTEVIELKDDNEDGKDFNEDPIICSPFNNDSEFENHEYNSQFTDFLDTNTPFKSLPVSELHVKWLPCMRFYNDVNASKYELLLEGAKINQGATHSQFEYVKKLLMQTFTDNLDDKKAIDRNLKEQNWFCITTNSFEFDGSANQAVVLAVIVFTLKDNLAFVHWLAVDGNNYVEQKISTWRKNT